MDNMESEAKSLLIATHCSGKYKRFKFERYVKIQKDQHHILEGLKGHGHVEIDPRSQVRYFIEGNKITQFHAVKFHIIDTASLRIDYDGCVSLYKTFIDQRNKVCPPALNISGVDSSNHKLEGQKKRKGGSGGAVEDV